MGLTVIATPFEWFLPEEAAASATLFCDPRIRPAASAEERRTRARLVKRRDVIRFDG